MQKQYFKRGYAMLVTVISGVALIGLMGLGVDTGWVDITAHELQITADAAALAGAKSLPAGITDAQLQATLTAVANSAGGKSIRLSPNPNNAAGGDIVIGVWNSSSHTFTPTLNSPNAVQVLARRTSDSLNGALPLFFGGMFGISMANVSRSAIAINDTSNGVIISALTGSKSLYLHDAAADVEVDNGSIYVNSNSSQAVKSNNNATLSSAALFIAGNELVVPAYSGGQLYANANPIADPIVAAGIPSPPQPPLSPTASSYNVCCKEIEMSPS